MMEKYKNTHVLFVEYVWRDAYGGMRSKNRVLTSNLNFDPTKFNGDPNVYIPYIPIWNFDGSSTGQAPTIESEIILNPVACFFDPFIEEELSHTHVHLLVLCDCYLSNGAACETNTRFKANNIFKKKLHEKPWYGMEQEFFIIDTRTGLPLGFPEFPAKPRDQGPYYCSVGAENAFGRSLVVDAYHRCFRAGVKVSGMNGEVALGQWEIQVGPLAGIAAGDHVYMLRYILERTSEIWSEQKGKSVRIDYSSKPLKGEKWNGSGMHTNFSTHRMRHKGGYKFILDAIKKLASTHKDHLNVYGDDNHLRLTGKNETSDPDIFTYSVGGRGDSVRIPTNVYREEKGYFEDRRPSSSCDTYIVTSKIFETCCL